jgi:hypothetical protein
LKSQHATPLKRADIPRITGIRGMRISCSIEYPVFH